MTEKPELHPDEVHNELLENPKYAVYTHEKQINRIIEILEELSGRVVALEDKFPVSYTHLTLPTIYSV